MSILGQVRPPGDFRCLVPGCGWVKQGIWRQSARKHMQRRHPGVPFAPHTGSFFTKVPLAC